MNNIHQKILIHILQGEEEDHLVLGVDFKIRTKGKFKDNMFKTNKFINKIRTNRHMSKQRRRTIDQFYIDLYR